MVSKLVPVGKAAREVESAVKKQRKFIKQHVRSFLSYHCTTCTGLPHTIPAW